MPVDECYRPELMTSAFCLRWSWTGWPSTGSIPILKDEGWCELATLWERDGINLLEKKVEQDYLQATVSTGPNINPSLIVSRIKGRIDHCFRTNHIPFKFSRKVSLRAIGNNTICDVQEYIGKQLESAKFYDSRFADNLKQWTRVWYDGQESALPIEVASGRYWYLLHLVLVVDGRHRISDLHFLGEVFEIFQVVAQDRGYLLLGISVMPDHVHLSLRGIVPDSPETIAVAFMNESCKKLKAPGLWRPSYYVGTAGAYNMNAVRS